MYGPNQSSVRDANRRSDHRSQARRGRFARLSAPNIPFSIGNITVHSGAVDMARYLLAPSHDRPSSQGIDSFGKYSDQLREPSEARRRGASTLHRGLLDDVRCTGRTHGVSEQRNPRECRRGRDCRSASLVDDEHYCVVVWIDDRYRAVAAGDDIPIAFHLRQAPQHILQGKPTTRRPRGTSAPSARRTRTLVALSLRHVGKDESSSARRIKQVRSAKTISALAIRAGSRRR